MARDHGRILTKIWRDPEWRRLPHTAQWLYFHIISQPEINAAGVLSVNVPRWARGSDDLTDDDVYTAFKVLVQRRYIVVDEYEDEALVRSFMRNDGIVKQPKVMIGACRQAVLAQSSPVRRALAAELERVRDRVSDMARKEVDRALEELTEPDPDPDEVPERDDEPERGKGIHAPEETLSAGRKETRSNGNRLGSGVGAGVGTGTSGGGSVLSSSQVEDADQQPSETTNSAKKPEPHRDDTDALCQRLADRIEGNDLKRPNITDEWRRSARLLLDRDGRDLDEALRLVDWAQSDDFWDGNCLSLPTFRKQYDQMLSKARKTARWRIATPPGQRQELTAAEVKAIVQPGHRDFIEPPEDIAEDAEARSAWYQQQYEERLAADRAAAERLLETSDQARSILARLRRTS